MSYQENPLAWNISSQAKQDPKVLIEFKRAQYETDVLYYKVFSTDDGKKLLETLQNVIVNKIGYHSNLPNDKAFANMLIRDAQAMLVQAFQAGVERINKAPNLEDYVNL